MPQDEALLAVPMLSVQPLYPGGFFPPVVRAEAGEAWSGAVAARLRMDSPAALEALHRLSEDVVSADSADNVRAGQRVCEVDVTIERGALALLSGDVVEAHVLASRVVNGQRDARALILRACAAGVAGRWAEALDDLAAAESLLARGDDATLALLLANRSAALLGTGAPSQAEKVAAEALRAGRRKKDDGWVAVGAFALALAHLARGRRADARARLADAVRGFAREGDVLRQVQCHHLLGEIAYDGEDPIRAGNHYRDGLALARPAGALAAVELLTLRFEHR